MIECCRYCVPPKRNSTCHCYCKDYKEARENHETERLKIRKIKDLDSAFSQKIVEKRIKNYSN